jgi:UDP-N-acetylmuramoyl-tripeptide--D-alanyl-D-alanine ligase
VCNDDLFVAIVGKRLDGHVFVPEAVSQGAAGALVARAKFADCIDSEAPVILANDTTKALQDLARWHRRRFRCPVIAVTGSNGKTTTKDLTWHILSVKYRTLRSEGSKNNHIGLPLTLMGLDQNAEAAVVELGTSAFGEIRDLASICSPDVGCITNIGPAHLEFFETVANVAEAKAELLDGMAEGAPAVLNVDDEWYDYLRSRAKGPVVTFGIYRPADFMGEDIHAENGSVTFRLIANPLGARRYVRVPFPGSHNVYNALSAAAIASQLGLGIAEIKEGLAKAALPAMRYEVSTISDITVINDAYNANPVSTRSALASFCEMSVSGKRIFVCGDMLELGPSASEAHRQLGRFIRSLPIDYVIALGNLAPEVLKGAFGNGHRGPRWAGCGSVEEVVSILKDVAVPGDAVLIKGSRANGMERIVDVLRAGALAPSIEEAIR